MKIMSFGLGRRLQTCNATYIRKNASVLPVKGPTGEALGNKCAQVTDENAILEGHKSGANADEFALQVNYDSMKIDEN